jgi:hypothetical protein
MMRMLKEECLWLQVWRSPFTFLSALERLIGDYHEQYLHSAMGYKPPKQFAREDHLSHVTQLVAA